MLLDDRASHQVAGPRGSYVPQYLDSHLVHTPSMCTMQGEHGSAARVLVYDEYIQYCCPQGRERQRCKRFLFAGLDDGSVEWHHDDYDRIQTGKYTLVEQQDVGIDSKATEQKVQKWYSILFDVSSSSIAKPLRAHYLLFVVEPFGFVPLGASRSPTTVEALHAGTLQFFLTDTRIFGDGAFSLV
jgi:hypothetical protein